MKRDSTLEEHWGEKVFTIVNLKFEIYVLPHYYAALNLALKLFIYKKALILAFNTSFWLRQPFWIITHTANLINTHLRLKCITPT